MLKKLWFIHELTANDTSKTEKNYKKAILLNSTLTFKRCAGGQSPFVISAVSKLVML